MVSADGDEITFTTRVSFYANDKLKRLSSFQHMWLNLLDSNSLLMLNRNIPGKIHEEKYNRHFSSEWHYITLHTESALMIPTAMTYFYKTLRTHTHRLAKMNTYTCKDKYIHVPISYIYIWYIK